MKSVHLYDGFKVEGAQIGWRCLRGFVIVVVRDAGDGCESGKEAGADVESDVDGGASDDRSVLVYMIDPFSYSNDSGETKRLSMLGLLRCFHEMVSTLPAHFQHRVQLQVRATPGGSSTHFSGSISLSRGRYYKALRLTKAGFSD